MPSGNILLADDDAAIRTVLNQALSRAGYEVRSTGNASTLWRWVSQGDGDLVITDVVMPDENAFDLLPRIKRMRPDLPIIVMSAQKHLHDGDQGFRARCLRISAQAVRSEGTRLHRRAGLVAPRADALASVGGRGRGYPAGRAFAGHAGDLPRAGAPDADRSDGDDHRRIRDRQRNSLRAPCTITASGARGRSSQSTWRRFRVI